ncbi:hypothetical protein G6L67_04170 [Agrobacterium tumefaciens]|uniref:N-acetyltransferase domain-containing protein n=2 Tax=Agrobacterium tumefaciens TaxID=358 RepID=A0A1S7Q2N6_AGRTU|nr:hypothetical protein At12D1_04560 [Agrobacterium tumefaciens]NTE91042.1 hypothetical protein [Agrobacterium tumefaciens]CUX30449.1 conserved hypothetical protein [Agrobacterium tumefaciens str. Kerr 14]
MTLHDQNMAENSPRVNSEKKGIKVRLLEKDDTLAVREIMKQHHASTVFRDQEFSDWKLNEHFNLILSRPPRMVCPIATLDGKPVGVTWAIADSYMLSDGPMFVTVHVIAVDLSLPSVRRAKVFLALVAAIKKWATSLNASHSFIHVTTGSRIEATDRLMKAAGATPVGGAYKI